MILMLGARMDQLNLATRIHTFQTQKQGTEKQLQTYHAVMFSKRSCTRVPAGEQVRQPARGPGARKHYRHLESR
jgi:hypothetical protein